MFLIYSTKTFSYFYLSIKTNLALIQQIFEICVLIIGDSSYSWSSFSKYLIVAY